MTHGFKLRPKQSVFYVPFADNMRVCASCMWSFEYDDVGFECPRCNFGSYSIEGIADSREEKDYFMSQAAWRESSHLPKEIADFIVKTCQISRTLENL